MLHCNHMAQNTDHVISLFVLFFIFCNIQFSVIQPSLPVTLARNRMLSMDVMPSLQSALFQSGLTGTTFHTLLWMGIIQKLLSKWRMSLCTLQEVWALVANIFCHPVLQPKCSQWHIRITHDGMFTAPAPQAKFFS